MLDVYDDYIFAATMKTSELVQTPHHDTLNSTAHGRLIHRNYTLSVGNFSLHIDDLKPN